MIVILDPQRRVSPPAWLVGAENLCQAESQHGFLWGVGEPYLLGMPPVLHPIEDGYQVGGVVDQYAIDALAKPVPWCDVASTTDLAGRIWRAPLIFDALGARRIRVAYGTDWMPALTPIQIRACDIATEARRVLAAVMDGADVDVPLAVCCQWTAELLGITQYLTPLTCQALALIDDRVSCETLAATTGVPIRTTQGGDHG